MSGPRAGQMTLPDMVILLVTLALLLAVVVPEWSALRQRSLEGVMREDLRRLAAAEDSYYYDHQVYGADPAQLRAVGFQASPGVQIVVHEATAAGWSASAERTGTAVRCSLFARQAAPVAAARIPGEVACR